MENKLHALLEQIQQLEKEVASEIQGKEKAFLYKIKNRKVFFAAPALQEHQRAVKHVFRYLYDARFLHILTAPVIWLCVLPAMALDLAATLYQGICFPVYGIPKVVRGDYIRIDRQFLRYLNIIEKVNCVYCGYFNGLTGYWQEMAARTEQYWCPIKHAVMPKVVHSRYKYFLDYGDSRQFRDRWDKIRTCFDDLKR